MNNKSIYTISRRAIVVLLIVLLLELALFSIMINSQPAKREVVINKIDSYKQANGFGYSTVDVGSSFYSTSIYSMMGRNLDSSLNASMQTFVLSRQDTDTGLFKTADGKISLHETYYAVGLLNQLSNIQASLNATLLQTSIMGLRSSNGFFREYTATDEVDLVYGDLSSLFEAVSILSKISQNTTEFYLSLNRTQIAQSLSVIQRDDGSMNSGYFKNEYTMKNIYYTTSIIDKLNVSRSFFDDLGLRTDLLLSWINDRYTHDGFRMTSVSEPTIEASAYALISLKRLGQSNDNITLRYSDAIDEVVHEMIDDINEEVDPIDSLHDIILALSITGNLNRLNEKQVPEGLENTMGALIITTSILLLLAFTITSLNLLREDDTQYFDSALNQLLPIIIEDQEVGKEKLSELLDLEIQQIVLIEHQNSARGSIRAKCDKIEILITFTFDTWDPLDLKLFREGSMEILLSIDFYDSKLVTKVQEMIKVVIETIKE